VSRSGSFARREITTRSLGQPKSPAGRGLKHASRQLLLRCPTSCIHAVVLRLLPRMACMPVLQEQKPVQSLQRATSLPCELRLAAARFRSRRARKQFIEVPLITGSPNGLVGDLQLGQVERGFKKCDVMTAVIEQDNIAAVFNRVILTATGHFCKRDV
jgi:hypothetical protein